MGRGKKDCPNCSTEIGARTQLCKCGYHYPSGKIRKDLLAAKVEPEKDKTYSTEGRGRKRCPGCNLIVGGRIDTCFSCGFDFVSAKKEKNKKAEEKKEQKKVIKTPDGEKISPEIALLMAELAPYEEPEKLTPNDHADRILSYGNKRAASLVKAQKSQGGWSHINWERVKEGVV